MSNERLIYLPLGGAGEVGLNSYVYGYGQPNKERFVLIDLGVAFPNMETSPGVDLIFPDMTWLMKHVKRLEAIFITHAHEDHVGAMAHYCDVLPVPIYVRLFTANILMDKMKDLGKSVEKIKVVRRWTDTIDTGSFRVRFLPVSHSIPESSSLVIESPGGTVIHTGDFKIDPGPVVGAAFDVDLWKNVSSKGIHALVCDSTNVHSGAAGRSESGLAPEIESLIKRSKGMVIATTFASNIARVKTLADAAVRAGRSICILGRAMRRMVDTAVRVGVLTDFPKTVSPENARDVPRENLMLIVTGSQGEPRAASAQLSRGKYMKLEVREGDLFLFSSKTIPGNERGVLQIINQFSNAGVDVIDDSSPHYHVSGHANRPDLEMLHQLVHPKIIIPMHGEHRHLREHARLCRQNGYQSIVATNGTIVDLSGDVPVVAGYVETGRDYLDGKVKYSARDGIVRERLNMAVNGHVSVNVVYSPRSKPTVQVLLETMGLSKYGRSGLLDRELHDQLTVTIKAADRSVLENDTALREVLEHTVKQTCRAEIGKTPTMIIMLNRLN